MVHFWSAVPFSEISLRITSPIEMCTKSGYRVMIREHWVPLPLPGPPEGVWSTLEIWYVPVVCVLKLSHFQNQQAFDSIAGNTVVPYRFLKKFFNYHKLLFFAIYYPFCSKIRLQITKLWAGHVFAARSCCDLDLQGSDPNLAHDIATQYGDHFCEIVLKSDFK